MKFPKPTRLKDKQVLESVRKRPCCACGKWGDIHAHHIKTRGAGGGDTFENLLPLCMSHHTEIHKIGAQAMREKYWQVEDYLKQITTDVSGQR